MKAIKIFIFILSIQTSFAQTVNSEKFYQLHKSFKDVEDSISKKINFQNTIIYKTCEDYKAFYFIEQKAHWTGYFIKNLLVDGLNLPTRVDTLKNGNIVKFEPFQTELSVFNADSLIKSLMNNHIDEIQQISEDSIQVKFISKGKKKNQLIMQSLPHASHDCNGTIIIYGQKNISATYRCVLIDAKDMHIIPTLKIFYETKRKLVNTTKNYDN
jgi:hypothetical protein